MTTFNWLSLFGVPALIAAVFAYVFKKLKQSREETTAIKLGIQALLRDRLYQLYRYCEQKGCATIEERQNFDNMYKQYHGLGANGVMGIIKTKLDALPTHD